jgi:DNA-directed RNA polymerase subunit M/transcription elongation factor TFIIS
MATTKLPKQCEIARKHIYDRFHTAVNKLQQKNAQLLEEYNKKYANAAARYKYENDTAYDTIIRYIAAHLEYGCRLYSMKQCLESSIVPNCACDNALFIQHYSDSMYKIIDLIGDENGELIYRILHDDFKLEQVADMDASQLCPSIMRAEREQVELRRAQKITQKVSHSYTCRKCGGHSTITHEKQTRCSDEAPTIFIQCTDCSQKWSVNG